MEKEVTTNEIMGFLHEQMEFLQEHMATKEDLSDVRNELRKEMKESEHRILDKVDEKIDDLKGDLVVMMRKEDQKVTALIEILKKKEVLDEQEASSLLSLRPFPQM